MINGKRYDWEDLSVNLPQGVAIHLTAISYSDGQSITARYGKGGVVLGYGRNNYEGSGSMTIDIEEWERLKSHLGSTIYDHDPFPITASYANSGMGTITDKLLAVKITKVSTSNSQGSENAGAKDIEFVLIEPINYNGKPAKRR